MSNSRRPCKFINGGCRFGANCKFSHDRSARNSSPTPSAGSRAGGSSPSAPNSSTRPAHAPRGNCDFFWSSGQCNRGFECTFQHIKNPHGTAAPAPAGVAEETEQDALDFSSIEGLAEMNHISLNELHKLDPAGAHNQMRSFTGSHYQFSGPEAMIRFACILGSVDRRSTEWVRLTPLLQMALTNISS